MQPLYTTVKVNNEMELCEVSNPECRKEIERALLKNRISYFVRWPKVSFFSHSKNSCIICVNESVAENAVEIVRAICEEGGYPVKFLMRHSTNRYL
ncbi:MAG: hypothetical protein IJ747_06800 [Lachnospiraceae bacterium]|nr:hypothetical protein [Lachnospiraceae bacterium]